MHFAALMGHLDIVKYLHNQGANIDVLNCYKESPLYLASSNGHQKIIEYLIENGAEVNKVTDSTFKSS